MNVHLIAEGHLELPVGRKLVRYCGHRVGQEYPLGGSGNIKNRAYKYAPLARSGEAVLVLTDFMDTGCDCVPRALAEYRARNIGQRTFLYRFAVPELESWLLADAEHLARFLRVARTKMPEQPEGLPNPKRTLVNLARTSNRRAVKEALVPPQGCGGAVGRLYVPTLTEFVEQCWDVAAAAERAPSLARCVKRLRELG